MKREARGQIRLPPRRTASVNGRRHERGAEAPPDRSPIACPLEALQPLGLEPAPTAAAIALFHFLLRRSPYLGQRNGVGENLKYRVRDGTDRPLAGLLFGAAAGQVRAREAWIGGTPKPRQKSLFLLAHNARFLILPWVRAPHLGSPVLAQVTARWSADWPKSPGQNNAQSLFQVEEIPGPNPIRDPLDPVPPAKLFSALR